jgi:hypothetical protein
MSTHAFAHHHSEMAGHGAGRRFASEVKHLLLNGAAEDKGDFLEEHPAKFDFWHPWLPKVADCEWLPEAGSFATGAAYMANAGDGGRLYAYVWSKTLPLLALLLALAIPATAQPCKVNLTSGTVAELALLPGVGAVTAQAIAEAKPADETALDAVKGIGPAKLAAIRPHAAYGAAATTRTEKQKKGSKDGAQ